LAVKQIGILNRIIALTILSSLLGIAYQPPILNTTYMASLPIFFYTPFEKNSKKEQM